MKPRLFPRAVMFCLAIVTVWTGASNGDTPPDSSDYLCARSEDGSAILGDFFSFQDRFVVKAPGRIYDRFLKVTWIELPEIDDYNRLIRMDWDSAHRLARKLKARLPKLEELKTLITKQSVQGRRAFVDIRFFPLSSHSPKCWTSEGVDLFLPHRRVYVDFARPAWGTTSMSEVLCVLLISKE
jgi:hypothetical protein